MGFIYCLFEPDFDEAGELDVSRRLNSQQSPPSKPKVGSHRLLFALQSIASENIERRVWRRDRPWYLANSLFPGTRGCNNDTHHSSAPDAEFQLTRPFSESLNMDISLAQKRAALQGIDTSDVEQVFNAVTAAIIAAAGNAPEPAAWARPDELDRLADTGISGRACFLSKEKRERCTVALYAGEPNNLRTQLAGDLVLAAVHNAISTVREAASQLEDIQFRAGMETACDEIASRLPLVEDRRAEQHAPDR